MRPVWRNPYLFVWFWLLFAGSFLFQPVFAQNGNEWIQFNQDYYRIPVGKDGLYRITYNDLQVAGFPVGSVDPLSIQLFHRGIEQAIYVEGQEDSEFNPGDFIEFYGRKNDGTSDTELYKPASAQPHTYYNLYSDTTVYFLTINSSGVHGKRILKTWQENTNNLTPESSHQDVKLLINAQQGSGGRAYSTYVRTTFFDVGEMWTGVRVNQNNTVDYTVEVINNQVLSDGLPILEVMATGRADLTTPHRVEIYVGPSASSLRLIATRDILQFESSIITQEIQWSDIGTDGKIVVRMRVLATGTSARASVTYIKLYYPQSFNVNGSVEKYFNLRANPTNESFIEISNFALSGRLYDITDPTEVKWYSPSGTLMNPVISGTSVPRKLFLTSVHNPTGTITKVSFRKIIPAQHNYIIISHPLLMKPGGDYANPVKAYAAYRASEPGGLYDTLVVDVNQLYNQFNYGEVSPLAIHRFMRFMVEGGSPSHLFIIGKGLDWFYGYHRNPNDTRFRIHKDLVPSAGYPASDMYYTIGLGSTQYEPAVSTGRISATNPSQVAAYLNKVKEMEALPFNDLWRKNLIHLSGGVGDEIELFKRYLQDYGSIAKDVFLGGSVRSKTKSSTELTEIINISEEVNKGANLITFFGHSSATNADFEVGFVSNPSYGYDNPGKYPMFLINGCQAGDFFADSLRYGEDWILASNKGAIGFIAHTYFGFTSTLRYYSDLFYRLAYADSVYMRKGIGEIQKELARRYMSILSSTEINQTQVGQMLFLGDPALSLFAVDKPDYETNNTQVIPVSLDGQPITAFSDKFALNIIVRNFGRAQNDSLRIKVTRSYNNITEIYDSVFNSVFYQDTLQFIIPQERNKGYGENIFTVEIDSENLVSEINELNNSASIKLFISLNISRNLYPLDFTIVNSQDVKLIFSSSDVSGISRDFEVEIDTVHTFSSPAKKKYIVNGTIAEKLVELYTIDSLVYYWRTRFKDPQAGEVSDWVSSSFSFINNGPEGWAQIDNPQYLDNTFNGLINDPELNLLSYSESKLNLSILTYGSNPIVPIQASVKLNNEEYNPADVEVRCRNNTINLIAFEKQSILPYRALPLARSCGKRPQIINSFLASDLPSIIPQYMQNVPAGDSVVLFTIGNPNVEGWSAAVKLQFEALGISSGQLSSVKPGEPIVIFAKKGAPVGSARIFKVEGVPDDSLAMQELFVSGTITGRFYSGSMTSGLVGPAQNWEQFIAQSIVSEIPQTDKYFYNLFGVTLEGQEDLVLSNSADTIDLSFIDADVYPYLRLTYQTRDSVNLTPPQLIKWIVSYTPVAEGVLTIPEQPVSPRVVEGESWLGTFGFKNISQKHFTDSLTVRFGLFNQTNRTSSGITKKIGAPAPEETTVFDLDFNTLNHTGLNDVNVFVNPRIVPEQYYDNNQVILTSYLQVDADVFDPVMDVTIDGRHLFNGDYVSPNPTIRITVQDINSFIKITDSDAVKIRLKYPKDAFTTEINFDREDITWSPQTETEPFTVYFKPVDLPEGDYVLEVEARDARNNTSGQEPYKVEFKVVYNSSVTMLAPYPNPSVSDFLFEFIIAGQTPPDQLVLNFISVDGRVVYSMEVTELHIGTNRITWQGKGFNGFDLPGGLYLYNIQFVKDGEIVPVFLPEGENFLKGGYGKLVISR
jgi:hypothetical protein